MTLALMVVLSSVNSVAAKQLRLIGFGDSLMQGYGLAQDQGFVPQLTRWLGQNGRPDVSVINMGVSGDTTTGGLARMDWALAEGADALILELGGNDLLRGVNPQTSRENIDAMLGKLSERGIPVLLAGLSAPLNYGPEFKQLFDRMYPDLATRYGAILFPSFLGALEGMDSVMQEDGIHPNAKGVDLIVHEIGPYVLELLDRSTR